MARTLSYQVGILTLGRFAAYLAMFFVPLVNVRALSAHDYGVYRQYWLIFETMAGVLVMAFPNSLLYYFPRAEGPRIKSTYVGQTLVFLFGMGLASWGIYGILLTALGEGLGGVIQRYFWPFCLFTLFMMVSQYMDRLFIAERQVERQSWYQAVTSIVLALTVITVSYFTHQIDLIIWALLAFAFLRFLFAVVYAGVAYRPSLRDISVRSFREQFSYAIPLGLAAIVVVLLAKTDKFIITHFFGREMFAVYSIGAFQIPIVEIIRSSISNVTFPLMARYQKEGNLVGILDLWQRATLKTAVLFFPVFVFFEISAKPFITVLFTERYSQAAPVFMIYLLLFLRSIVEAGAVPMVFKRNTFLFRINVAAFIVNLVLSIILLKRFGWLGVPFATVIAIYLQAASYMVLSSRLLKTPFSRLMPWGALARRLVTALVPGALLYLFYVKHPIGNFVELAVAGIAYFAVYFVVCFRLRFISLAEIKSMLRKNTDD